MATDTASAAPDKTAQNRTLTARQRKAVAAILQSTSMDEAAGRSGVARSTLYAWMHKADFRDELTARQDDLFRVALTRLKALVAHAVDGLGKLIEADSESIRRAACRDILTAAFQAHDSQEIEKRLLAVEDRLQQATRKDDEQ